jgi:mRNA-degrading endonuclease RelE of RelBE toxin-antitoxin system
LIENPRSGFCERWPNFGDSGEGDVKALAGEWQGYFRLRVGEYRVMFTMIPGEITVVRVRHRSAAYR